MKQKILICYKNPKTNDPNACHIGMGVTSNNNARFLNRNNIEAYSVPVVDGYHLKNLLNKEYSDVTRVIMSAPFFDTGFLKSLCNNFPKIQFTITFHSNSGFLGMDKWSMGMLGELMKAQEEIKNFEISVNSEKFAKTVNSIFRKNTTTLPNLYPYDKKPMYRKNININILKIGSFSAIRSLKNIPTAAFAAAILCKELYAHTEFHIVVGRNEDPQADKIISGIENLFKHIPNIKLVKNDWRDNEEFKELVKQMNIIFMPSFTESFNNVTADAISVGTPVVVGEAINWLPKKFRANADDAKEIAEIGKRLLFDEFSTIDGLCSLDDHNKTAFKYWKSYLGTQEKTFVQKIKGFFKLIFKR